MASINGVEVDLEFFELYHEVKSKVALDVKLTPKERSFYLLFVASIEEASEYLKKEKNKKN